MKDFWKEPPTQKLNKKRITFFVIILIIIITTITISIIYVKNKNFREWFDTTILRKEVKQDQLETIEFKEEDNPQIHAFNQYIAILSKNELKLYNSSGKEEKKLSVEISTPIFNSQGRYLVVAENKGQKIYCITDKDIAWEQTVEGKISQIHVSKNGYVAITIVDTTYKTIISVYNEKGELQFNQYLSSIRVSDVVISNDNKYLAMAEIDTSGIVIESKIEVISVEKAKTDPNNSKIATYTFENNELITNIEYQDKGRLICMSKDKITKISLEGEKEELANNESKKTAFQSIELNNTVVTLEEKASSLFTADSIATIINTENKNTVNYTTQAVTKELYTYENIIALNLGTEIEFINTGGWLVKRYKAEQEITDITLSGNLAGIIYRDKVEIVNL